jgi:hypothetical protein
VITFSLNTDLEFAAFSVAYTSCAAQRKRLTDALRAFNIEPSALAADFEISQRKIYVRALHSAYQSALTSLDV